jgi:transposase-like protein
MPAPIDRAVHRRAVQLLFIENMTTRQVAEALGLAMSTVSKWKRQQRERAGVRLVSAYKFLVAGDADRAARLLRSGIAMLGHSVGDD